MEDWEKELEDQVIIQPVLRYGVHYCPYDGKELRSDTIGYYCGTANTPFGDGPCGYRILWEMLDVKDEMGDESTWDTDTTPGRHIMIVDCRNKRATVIGGNEKLQKELKDIVARAYGVYYLETPP